MIRLFASRFQGGYCFLRALAVMARQAWFAEGAAQIVEFAVALPLLVVFVVGIFDFSNAFTLKQKLTNVTRDAARTVATEPTSDLGNAMPISVSDAFYIIDNYLKANNINDCGVNPAGTPAGIPLTWKFTVAAAGPTGCGITIIINRGYYYSLPVPAQPPPATCLPTRPNNGETQMVGTCISLQYSYPWRFGQAASLIGGSGRGLPTMISAQAIAANEF